MSMAEPILIATFGNVAAGDDGFGPRVAELLAQAAMPGVEVADLATGPARLLDLIADRAALVVVDAAWGPHRRPGRLIVCDWHAEHRPALLCERGVSTHALGVADQLALAGRLGMLPPVVKLVAATIGDAEQGRPPCAAVRRQVAPAARRIRDLLARLPRAEEPAYA